MPMLWHIMKIYSAHGLNDFVICCGYKGHLIKKYFLDFFHRRNDLTIDLRTNSVEVHRVATEPWRVTLADTGLETMTGGRLRRVRDYVGDETFCLTYGDGVSDIDITALIDFHRAQRTLATVTAVQQPGRFGALDFSADGKRVDGFREKSVTDGHLINGGFFVCEPGVIDYIEGDATVWEQEPLKGLVAERPARRLPPQGLLAEHGHAARQARAAGDVGQRQGAVEGLGPAAPRRPARAGAS